MPQVLAASCAGSWEWAERDTNSICWEAALEALECKHWKRCRCSVSS